MSVGLRQLPYLLEAYGFVVTIRKPAEFAKHLAFIGRLGRLSGGLARCMVYLFRGYSE